jgi:hypothetical protein
MLEWKSRLVILLAFATVVAVAFGESLFSSARNFGW